MKLMILVALALVAAVVAAPPPPSPDQGAQILRSDFNQEPDGPYVFSFETDNGIKRSETGELKDTVDEDNKPRKVVVVRGEYTYTDSEGNPEVITYYADETGFHPEGKSVPKTARR